MFNGRGESFVPDLVSKDSKVTKGLVFMHQIVVNMMTKISTYWHNSRIVAMKPDPVGGVGVVEFPLE